jgi:hypothetical protein
MSSIMTGTYSEKTCCYPLQQDSADLSVSTKESKKLLYKKWHYEILKHTNNCKFITYYNPMSMVAADTGV